MERADLSNHPRFATLKRAAGMTGKDFEQLLDNAIAETNGGVIGDGEEYVEALYQTFYTQAREMENDPE